MPSAPTATPGSAAAATASSATTRSSTSAAISTTVWTISGSTFAPAAPSHARNRITVEVGFVVREISAALDGQSGRTGDFSVARLATLRSGLATTHLCPLLFEDRLARKPDAVTLHR